MAPLCRAVHRFDRLCFEELSARFRALACRFRPLHTEFVRLTASALDACLARASLSSHCLAAVVRYNELDAL